MNTEIIENKKLNRRFFNEVSDFLHTASESLKSFLTFHDIKPEDVLLIENKK